MGSDLVNADRGMLRYLQGQPAALARRRPAGGHSASASASAVAAAARPATAAAAITAGAGPGAGWAASGGARGAVFGGDSSLPQEQRAVSPLWQSTAGPPLKERVMAAVERMNADRRRAEQGARTMRFITANKVVSPRGNHCRAFSTAPAQSHRSLRLSGKAQFSAKDGRQPRNRPRCPCPTSRRAV